MRIKYERVTVYVTCLAAPCFVAMAPAIVCADEVDAIGTRAAVSADAGQDMRVQGTDAADPFDIYFTERYSYEDNLFHVQDGLGLDELDAPEVESLDDYVNRASVGIQARLDAARQVFSTNLRLDDVRYQKNDILDFRGGSGSLNWDGRFGRRWSAGINAKYDRTQAGFTNYRLLTRDVVDSANYNGELRYAIGSRWAVLGSASLIKSDHSAESRKIDKFKGETARGGIQYQTPAGNTFAMDYRNTQARFPIADATPGGLPYKYDETQSGVNIAYAFTGITRMYLRGAYLDRDYADARLGDYSGAIWDGTVHWTPRTKLYFELKGWHKLAAYSDAESDYFVSDGGSIGPTWEPTSKITVSAVVSYEKQDYLASSTSSQSDPQREDEVSSALLGIGYAPWDFMTIALAYRWIERDSNSSQRGYDASIATAQIRITL